MVAPNLQAIVFNLIFDNLASTTKCLAHTLLHKMVEQSTNIVMWWRSCSPLSLSTFLLGIGLDAFSTTTYVINRLPMPVLGGLSPFEVLFDDPVVEPLQLLWNRFMPPLHQLLLPLIP
ncbi:hypothetical protein Pint_33474 [Pistacia integerrima]|uniref:Uncharacterized protein n=1 Tax=Pistacia integerrima TaxID=434235 RepID=A0ACC0X233_9ROSI|nr:hypothetical protein Pint_33474 [Pistacia integerrima]